MFQLELTYCGDLPGFLRCPDCGRIYWRGSHFKELTARLARFQ